MIILGITGGTGCGKTTALDCLKEYGCRLIDCDAVYHQLLQQDRDLLRALDVRFPGTVKNGQLDRKALGERVFADPAALAALNNTTGPFVLTAIQKEIDRARQEDAFAVAVDAIGLIESGLAKLCDYTIAVTAPEEDRVRRLIARDGISEDYARLRIRAQKSNAEFSALCDYTLNNDGSDITAFGQRCTELFTILLNKEKKA